MGEGLAIVGAWIIVALPIQLGVAVLITMRPFQKETFGRYQKAMTYAMIGIVFGMAYHFFGMIALWHFGAMAVLFSSPTDIASIMVFFQTAALLAGFVVVLLAARNLNATLKPVVRVPTIAYVADGDSA